ncbi:MAG: polysaccharide biosynthesis tyrosine autokinase [Actinomycetota bacterium]|nr:polysaccharide biosynthesis tyrosine autokinase [Actinomycetota bacterium]
MEHSHTEHQTDLKEYLRVLRTRKWSIILITAILTGAALFYSFRQTPIYQAQSRVVVQAFVLNPLQSVGGPQQVDLPTEAQLVATQAVAKIAAADLGFTGRPAQGLLHGLKVQIVNGTTVLGIAYRSPNPALAAQAANAFAKAYLEYRREQALASFAQAAATLQTQIDTSQAKLRQLSKQISALEAKKKPDRSKLASLQTQQSQEIAQLAVLQQQLTTYLNTAPITQGGGQVIATANVPTSPVSPNHIRTGAFAFVLGLGLGIGLAFLRERLDDSIRTRQELERRLGAPVLATVPRISKWKRGDDAFLVTLTDPKNPVSEAYRTLRTNLQFLATKGDLQTILVTSATAGDGKTATSANLAIVLAQAGRRVVLVSADLRRPRVHRFLNVSNEAGLSLVLADSVPVWQAVKDPGVPNLRVIPSGPVPPNPAELLQSDRMGEFLQQVQEFADFVIIDTPPVLAVADASILSARVDGTLFVVDADTASRTATVQARDQLENAGARVIGAVFNKFDPSQAGAYPYYYYYYYHYAELQDQDGKVSTNGDAHKSRFSRRGKKAQKAAAEADLDLPDAT